MSESGHKNQQGPIAAPESGGIEKTSECRPSLYEAYVRPHLEYGIYP